MVREEGGAWLGHGYGGRVWLERESVVRWG